ncbi:hypothetical protein H0R92_07200 [Treponema sp. OMZ 840]|uniref:hypothetical protein n=1 Tax=Treponema sp. OMZ 840 TaxID=244313 RepID=UPI003D9468D8
MQGELILLPDNFEVKDKRVSYEVIAFVSDKNLDKTSYIAFLQNRYPFLSGLTAQERIHRMTGGMTAQIAAALDVLIITMFVLVCVLTILFTELICIGEGSSFALLRIIGFDCKRLFAYQSVCTALIILPAAAAASCICAGTGSALTASLFTFTGLARFELIVSGLHTFMYFPFLFTLTVFAVSGAVYGLHNKINLKARGRL